MTATLPLRGRRQALQDMRLSALRDYGIVFAFLVLFVVLTFSSDVFLTQRNWMNILDQWSPVGIMACGWTLALIAGGFDLSIGAVYALGSVVAAKVALETGNAALGLIAGCLAGLVIGMANGTVITVGRINSFMATLASSFMIRGLALVISGGFLVRVVDEAGRPTNFNVIGRSELLGAKYSVWLFAGVIVVSAFVLHRTTFRALHVRHRRQRRGGAALGGARRPRALGDVRHLGPDGRNRRDDHRRPACPPASPTSASGSSSM